MKKPKFHVEIEREADQLLVRPSGQLTEEAGFDDVVALLTKQGDSIKNVLLDMGSVGQINSCGVREWITFLRRIQATHKTRFKYLGEIFVEQASIVAEMLGQPGTVVEIFEVPFHCKSCERREIGLFKPAELAGPDGALVEPTKSCSNCGKVMPVDVIPEEYFFFLKSS